MAGITGIGCAEFLKWWKTVLNHSSPAPMLRVTPSLRPDGRRSTDWHPVCYFRPFMPGFTEIPNSSACSLKKRCSSRRASQTDLVPAFCRHTLCEYENKTTPYLSPQRGLVNKAKSGQILRRRVINQREE